MIGCFFEEELIGKLFRVGSHCLLDKKVASPPRKLHFKTVRLTGKLTIRERKFGST